MRVWPFRKREGADRPGIWRAEVMLRASELEHRLRVAEKLPQKKWVSGQTAEQRRALGQAVKDALAEAKEAVNRDRGVRVIGAWWTGTAMTAGWESVHEAESYLLQLASEDDGRAMLPWLLAWIERVMDAGWLRRQHEKDLRAQIKDSKFDRTQARQALRNVVVANNTRYVNLRAFRNNLVVITGLVALLVAGLVAWNLANPGIVSLCAVEGKEYACLTGESPRPADVALVAFFGAIGGALSIAFGLAKTKSPPYRYDPKAWLGLLKPVAGAATAVIAVVFIQGDILLASEDTRSETTLLSYAAIFGFSQQVFTRFVDKRAEALIDAEEPPAEPADPSKKND